MGLPDPILFTIREIYRFYNERKEVSEANVVGENPTFLNQFVSRLGLFFLGLKGVDGTLVTRGSPIFFRKGGYDE